MRPEATVGEAVLKAVRDLDDEIPICDITTPSYLLPIPLKAIPRSTAERGGSSSGNIRLHPSVSDRAPILWHSTPD